MSGRNAPATTFRSLKTAIWLFFFAFAVTSVVPGTAAASEPYKVVGDLAVYLGVIPAPVVRGHSPRHPEGKMHGGASQQANEYHITIALFERDSGKRVEDAEVWATVSGLGHVGTTRLRLEPMSIAETVTYGGYVTMSGKDRYTIAVEVRKPGSKGSLKTEFTYSRGI